MRGLISGVVAGFLMVSTPAWAAETLKLGVVGGMTGGGAAWGLAIDGGVRVAVEEMNAAGGLKVGDETYMFEVVSYDDRYKAAEAVTATNRLIDQDGVKFIFGPIGSASVLAMKPITEETGTILLSNSYSNEVLTAGTKYLFRVLPTQKEYVGEMVGWLKENRPDVNRIAILSPNDATGWATQELQTGAYESHGYDIVEKKFFERTQNDFRTILAGILAQEVDAIELDTTPPSLAGIMIRQAREMGYTGLFTKFGGNNVGETVASAGVENVEGLLVYLSADPTGDAYAKMSADYARFHDNSMDDFTFFFYDAANMLFQAMAKAGTVEDTDAVAAEIENITPYTGIQGVVVWGGMDSYGVDHQILTPAYVAEVKGGEAHIIDMFEPK